MYMHAYVYVYIIMYYMCVLILYVLFLWRTLTNTITNNRMREFRLGPGIENGHYCSFAFILLYLLLLFVFYSGY